MPTNVHRHAAIPLIVAGCLIALAGCGESHVACPLPFAPSSTTCSCNQNNGACPPPPLPQVLYATGLSGQVTGFPVTQTGALGTPVSSAAPTTTLGMAALNDQFLYVSDFQSSSVDAWSINTTTAALSPVSGSPFTLGPFSVGAGLATNSTAQVLYVADAAKIDALQVDAIGALSALPGSPFSSGTNLFLTVDPGNRFLFASEDDPPGSVSAFTIDSTGALAAVQGSPFPTIAGYVGNTSPNAIVVDSTGSFVYTALAFDGQAPGQIAAFSIVSPSGALNPVPGSPFPAGNLPISLATAANFLYVASGGAIYGYSINPSNGVLTPLSGSPFPIPTGALTTDPFGRYLYASGAGGIMAFTINSTTGALTPIAGSPFPSAAATVLTFVL